MQNDDFLCFGHVTTERCVATPLWPIPDDFTLNNVFQVSQRKPTHKVWFRMSLKLLHLPCIFAREKCSTEFDCFRKLSRVVPVSAAPYITICPRYIKFKYLEEREKHFTPILTSYLSFIYTNQYLPFRWILALFLAVSSGFFKNSHDWISFVCTAREWSNPTWRRPGHVTSLRWRRCALPGLVSTNESTVPGDLGPRTNQRPGQRLAENALSGLFPVLLLRLPVRDRAREVLNRVRAWHSPPRQR